MNQAQHRLAAIAARAEIILLDFTDRFAVHGILSPAHLVTFSAVLQSLGRLTSIHKTLIALDKSALSSPSTPSASPAIASFLDLHFHAAGLLGRWLDALALPLADPQVPAYFEAVGCLHRLVSIHKTATLAPQRIGPRDLDALHAVAGLIHNLTGIELDAPTPSFASPHSPAATAPPSPIPDPQLTIPNSQLTSHNSQPEINPQSAIRNPQSLSVPAVPPVPAIQPLRACYLLTAPGAALAGVYQKIGALPGFSPSPASPSSPASDLHPVLPVPLHSPRSILPASSVIIPPPAFFTLPAATRSPPVFHRR